MKTGHKLKVTVYHFGMHINTHGVFQVFYYSNGVFLNAGIPEDKTAYAVLGTGVINVLITGISVSAYFLELFVGKHERESHCLPSARKHQNMYRSKGRVSYLKN